MENNQDTYIIITQWMLDCVPNSNSRLILGLINGLSSKYGYCIATNQYLSDKLQISLKTLERSLKFLEDNGFIKRNVYVANGFNCRKIYIIPPKIEVEIVGGSIRQNDVDRPPQNDVDSPPQNVGIYNKEYNKEIYNKQNAKSDTDIFGYYEMKVNKMLSAIDIQQLAEFNTQYDFKILKKAIDRMVLDNKPQFRNLKKLGAYLIDISKSQSSINNLSELDDIFDE